MPSIFTRLQHGWNAFLGRDPTRTVVENYGPSTYYRPDRVRFARGNDRSIVSSVINRIAMDAAQINLMHVRLEDDRYIETIASGLNNALTLDANIDQTGRAFIQDLIMSMCDEGVIAAVPTDTTSDPTKGTYDIDELRVGKITAWFPKHIKVEVYNENTGKREEIVLPKSTVAIIENPLYAVMNEPNSTLQRLKRVLANMDYLDSRNTSGKLDLIIQLPYVVKTETRKEQAEKRRKEIEMQLTGSKYGIAYTDGTERITQLNRPIENNYWTQAKELTSMLYNQLGLTESVFNGTADEKTMTNYYNRTIEPILSAISDEMQRKFLTKNARTRGHAIRFFRDPFKLVTIETLANVANQLKTAEVVSANEIRTIMGWKPSGDPKAEELRNSNVNQVDTGMGMMPGMEGEMMPEEGYDEGYEEELPEGEEVTEDGSDEELSSEEIDNLLEMLRGEIEELEKLKDEEET